MGTQLAVGDEVDGYVVEEVIAAGSTTTTYRATHDRLGRTVALKVFHAEVFAADPDAREAAHSDAVRAARLEHPAIATVYTSGPVDGGMYVASSLPRGGSLAEAVEAGQVTPARCAELVTILAGALATAHAADVNHREMRPHAVTIDRWGHPVLRDFGVTRLSGRTGMATRMEFGETLRYAAPELILGRKATPAADVYGLAATAWFCLTGEHPFPDLPVGQLVALRASATAPELEGSPAVARVLADGMALEPADRPGAEAFAERLAAAVKELPPEQRDAPSPFRRVAGSEAPAAVPEQPEPIRPADMTRVDRQRAVPVAPAPPAKGRPWAAILAWAGAALACALAGFAFGHATAPGPPALPRTGSIELVVGDVWTVGGEGVEGIELEDPLHLTSDKREVATVGTLERSGLPGDPIPASAFPGEAPEPEAVEAGGRAMVRYRDGETRVFALPLAKAALVAVCRPGTAEQACAAVLASARLGKAKPVPPAPTKQEAERVAEALRALEVARGSAEAELSGPAEGRANAANRLGSAFRTAAQALEEASSPVAGTLNDPLTEAATAYEQLASAIDRRSATQHRTARTRALRADARVRSAIAGLARAGYRTER